MKHLLDILRGMVIGLANLIPGVSGGTMMVSMGIYDKIIFSINNLFKQFKKAVLTLLPILIGMAVAIVLGSFGLKKAFADFPLPTNTLFIGLILGSIPAIVRQMKGEKIGPVGIIIFILFFAVVVVLKAVEGENTSALGTGVIDLIKYFFLGTIASSTMVIPGVSGSMILKTLGYYEPIVTGALPDTVTALTHGNWSAVGHNALVLVPFALGIVFGIFAIAKLIDVLMKRCKGWTYCAILGMVAASPVVILMDASIYAGVSPVLIAVSVVTFAVGFVVALKLSGDPEEKPAAAA